MNKSKKIKIGAAVGLIAAIAVVMAVSKTGQKPAGNMGMMQESQITVVKAETPVTGEIQPSPGENSTGISRQTAAGIRRPAEYGRMSGWRLRDRAVWNMSG